MSRSFRGLLLTVTMLWAIVPQLACFLPDGVVTETQSDCCKQMASDCGEAKMPSHDCCRSVVRSDIAMAGKVVRDIVPHQHAAATPVGAEPPASQFFAESVAFITAIQSSPPGPHLGSTILRI